ncbi:Acetyltransferase (GNAT) domain-containing protein [Rhizobium tibeticum]|uniref:Acetyltransferase (GNAT) domain-containing protein n=1 Tax=Rhizobium tibeticum TaxID=501024 RepID=A0A1H8V1X9_9HYPH|nr:GNAT family N-acetyltransferase [Rhizobium tibeticum]SEI18275.1 Protein involved in cellulose biosynthesis (CelD) [Rhizobium tibeticum]SEP09425.1 Acetyltransferase (GNAT) domain-containing protein [Rhizobium tibeticum]
MVRNPTATETTDLTTNRMVHELAALDFETPQAEARVAVGRPGRELCVYSGKLGYELQEELDFLSNRAMEPNVFFTGRFLAPAMPRLDDRQVNFVLLRDQSETHSRMRFLLPFSVEKPGFAVGPSIVRVWSNSFAPLGTPLIDAEDAGETLDNLFDGLTHRDLRLPPILVLPDVRLNGIFARMARAVAISRNLPITTTNPYQRAMLQSDEDAATYLRKAISSSHMREMRRQWRLLEEQGTLVYSVARQPRDIHMRFEEFLALEAGGWKGRKRSALVTDRYHTAFAREAVSNLAAVDAVRIHTIDLNGKAIASMVVLMMGSEAYTWKTAYDEAYARYSPGKLLMGELTEWHLDDANIVRSDSCAIPDHPMINRFWQEREDMGTMVIGLHQNGDRDVRQVAAQLHMYSSTRNVAKMLRQKIMSLARRGKSPQ